MWGTALALVAKPLAERLRSMVRRTMLMVLAAGLGFLAFLAGLGALYQWLVPIVGSAAAAGILAAGLGFLSLLVALIASRPSRAPTQPVSAAATPTLPGAGYSGGSWQILAAAFAAGIAAGRKI